MAAEAHSHCLRFVLLYWSMRDPSIRSDRELFERVVTPSSEVMLELVSKEKTRSADAEFTE